MSEKFNEDEKDLIDSIYETGLNRNMVKALVYIAKKGDAHSREIESNADLRQPEVSVAVNRLKERDWISKEEIKKKGKGRPVHHYSLKSDFEEIMDEIEEKEKRKIEEIEENLECIKDLSENIKD